MSPTLTTPCSACSPPDNQVSLDQGDTDFGSGGVLVLPIKPGLILFWRSLAGRTETCIWMNEDDLGGYSPSTK